MPSVDVVDLSRLQFAVTALYHFLFVPLTLGLSWILVIMESVYVMTGREIYRDMTKFWGKLFGINFAMGITTGITMEFQFGTNWAYFSHYVGDIFGAPLALEGLMAFFLESTFVGLFFFGWDRLGKIQHLVVTFLVALGSNLSALWILIANAWMQNPVGAEFNVDTMRMELASFADLLFNPVAGPKFVHTLAAGYVAASMFVLGISSYYLLRLRDPSFAVRSFAVAAGFGLASVLSVIVLGDESGYTTGEVQKVKLAAIEAEWETAKPPAAFTAFGFPDTAAEKTHFAIKIPYLTGLIATRSVDTPVAGHQEPEGSARSPHPQRHESLRGAAAAQIRRPLARGESRVRPSQGRPRLRPAAQEVHGERRGRDTRADSIRGQRHDSECRADLLVVSHHGRPRPLVPVRLRRGVPRARAAPARAQPLGDEARAVEHSAAVDRRRVGWIVAEYGRQPWTISEILPTICRCRRSRRADRVQPGRLHRVLHGAARRRALPHVQVHAARPVVARHRALPRRGGEVMIYVFDYATLKVIWWAVVGVLLVGFAILDGWDLGVGMLLPYVGRTDDERRVVLNAVGPTWEGNQVWFITAGGATFAAWPLVYATAFSGFYIALILVLFALFLRPVGFDYRSKVADPRWRSAWDWGIFVAGFVPALVFGVAFGNLLLGVPFHFDGDQRSFYTGSFIGLLNPFALVAGLVSVAMLTMHGGIYLQLRTEGAVQARAMRAARVAGIVFLAAVRRGGLLDRDGHRRLTRSSRCRRPIPAFAPTAKTVERLPAGWLANYSKYPWTIAAPLAAFGGTLLALIASALRRAGVAFIFSCVGVAGVVLTAGFALFPFIMPSSSMPASSLTVWDAVSSYRTLQVMLWAVVIFLPLIIVYTSWVYRVMRGKVTTEHVREADHSLY